MADILKTVSVISFIMAGVFVVIAIALWVIFKIPSVMGDLSGKTAKKSIERMRQNNQKTGDKSYKSSGKNLKRGELTGTMEGLNKTNSENVETGILNENLVNNYDEQLTGILIDESTEETAPLDRLEERKRRRPTTISVKLISEIMFVHTEEVI